MSVPFAFASVVIIWSTTALAVKWSLSGMTFWLAAGIRVSVAVVVCAFIILVTRRRIPLDADARRTYAFGGLSMYIGFAGTYWAAQYLSSGLLSVLWGLMPLVSGVLAAWLLNERFGRVQVLGILLGLLGLWLVFAASIHVGPGASYAAVVLIGMIILHAYCLVVMKRYSKDTPAFAAMSGGMAVTGLLFWISWLAFDRSVPTVIQQRTLYAILYLAVIGSVIGMGAYLYLLKNIRTSQATLATLLPPVCALALGHWLNDEPLTWHALSGAVLIVGGMVVSQQPWAQTAAKPRV